uniref:Uncharacterized protein n=1 Tax=Romanomermis culicivorax TaxID=13658 RepID=A0A915IXX6_ROMCU
MIPRFVVQALNCILFVAFAVYCLTALILLERDYNKRRFSKTPINQTNVTISVDGYSFTTSVTYADEDYAWTAILHFVAFLVQVYCFWILLLAYRYLRDWKVFLAYV